MFTAMTGNGDFRDALRFNHLTDIGFEQIITHAKAAVGVKLLLGEEKAIGAVEVAGGARRLP